MTPEIGSLAESRIDDDHDEWPETRACSDCECPYEPADDDCGLCPDCRRAADETEGGPVALGQYYAEYDRDDDEPPITDAPDEWPETAACDTCEHVYSPDDLDEFGNCPDCRHSACDDPDRIEEQRKERERHERQMKEFLR